MNKLIQIFVIGASTAVIAGGGAWLYMGYVTEKAWKEAVENCIRVKISIADNANMWGVREIRDVPRLKQAWFRPSCERDPKDWTFSNES